MQKIRKIRLRDTWRFVCPNCGSHSVRINHMWNTGLEQTYGVISPYYCEYCNTQLYEVVDKKKEKYTMSNETPKIRRIVYKHIPLGVKVEVTAVNQDSVHVKVDGKKDSTSRQNFIHKLEHGVIVPLKES